MTKALLIVNPSSGNEAAETYAPRVKEQLQKTYEQVEVVFTKGEGDATRFAREAAKSHTTAVFAMGGDGTVNETVTGLAEQPFRPDFSFIPFGTVNDLARSLGISLNPEEAVEQLANLIPQKLDVGKVNDSYFIDVVAIGAIPTAVQDVSVEQKTRLGSLAYILEGAKALTERKSYQFNLEIDDEKIEVESILLLVALTNSVAGFEKLVADATPDDGKLNLIVLKEKDLLTIIKLLPKLLTGDITKEPDILYRSFEKGEILVENEENLIANIDGDPGDSLPLRIQVLPNHLTILVPK